MTIKNESNINNGIAGAALLAGGIGSFAIGLFCVLAELSKGIKTFLTLIPSIGALSGKTIFGVLIWLVAWIILGAIWKKKAVAIGKIITLSFILLGLSILFTFPPFFLLFGG